MTTEENEHLIRVLAAVNETRKAMLQRLREIEAVVEGLMNSSPPEPPKEG